ncbi:MAG: insulinase family protein [Burkholderiales bacterium]|nr:insulinase family protein [Burkholderiales bacterium]
MKHPPSPSLRPLALLLALALGLVAPCLAATPAPLPTPVAVAPVVHQFTLANGMALIIKPDHRAPTAVNMVWVRVGSMDEVDGTSGVAHVLEHMLFKGTPTVPEGEFSRRVAALGGTENAFTSKDYTGYYQQVPANRLLEVMRLEADRFANNQWSDAVFAKELEVVKEERRMRTEDEPHARLGEAMDATVFLAHPHRRPVVGWMSDLDAMTADDARAFYQRWYTPSNAVIVVAGDVDVDQVRTWAEETYGRIAARAVPVRKPQTEPVQAGIRRLDFKAPAEQAYVALAFKVPGLAAQELDNGGTDALALTVLAAVLDGYDGARLDRALTQPRDHVADGVSAHYGLSGRGPQLFILSGVPAAGKTSAQVEKALRAEVTRVARQGVTEAELRRVKVQWMAGEIYKRDSVFNQANALGQHWINGFAPETDERLIARLRGVTAQQVRAVAARYFGDDALTVATLLPQPLDKNHQPRAPMAGPLR